MKESMLASAYPYGMNILHAASHYLSQGVSQPAQVSLRRAIDSCLDGRYKAASVHMRVAASKL